MLISNIYLLLIVLALTVPIYWAIPAKAMAGRRALMFVMSVAMLFLIDPALPLVPLAYFIVITILAIAFRNAANRSALRKLAWLAFLPLFASDLRPFAGTGSVNMSTLGLGFCALRAFLSVRALARSPKYQIGATLVSLSFFPTYLAGPIAGPEQFSRAAIATRLRGIVAMEALARIGIGAALFLVAKPAILGFEPGPTLGDTGRAWFGVYRQFLALYVDFSGYSEIAIGTARLFGFTFPENFNRPLLARSVREFWRRWHISLATLIGTYLAKPIARSTGRPQLAVVVAFLLVGLWHRVSVNYVIWGVGHGVAVALAMRVSRADHRIAMPPVVSAVLGWAATLTYVALLSAIANTTSTGAITMVHALIGLG